MSHKIAKIGCAAALLWLVVGSVPHAMAEVSRSHCGLISHDVANLSAVNPRHAYWCKSDVDGYLGESRSVAIAPDYAHRYRRHHHPNVMVTN